MTGLYGIFFCSDATGFQRTLTSNKPEIPFAPIVLYFELGIRFINPNEIVKLPQLSKLAE